MNFEGHFSLTHFIWNFWQKKIPDFSFLALQFSQLLCITGRPGDPAPTWEDSICFAIPMMDVELVLSEFEKEKFLPGTTSESMNRDFFSGFSCRTCCIVRILTGWDLTAL